jgi:excisionase family DNA binding protein
MQRAAAMVDDFRDMIVKLVREELAKLVVAPTEWMSTAEAAQFARVSQVTIRRWASRGRITAEGAGRGMRFRRAELEQLMKQGKRRRRVPEDSRSIKEMAREIWFSGRPDLLARLKASDWRYSRPSTASDPGCCCSTGGLRSLPRSLASRSRYSERSRSKAALYSARSRSRACS